MSKHRLNKKAPTLLLLITLPWMLPGCSESDSDGGITGTGSPLEDYLKHGIASNNQDHYACGNCLEEPALESDAGSDDQGSPEAEDFSRTNTQEAGVDELDWLKTDGNLIYSYNGGEQINIFEVTDIEGIQTPINTIPVETNRNYLRGLYLDETNQSNKYLLSVADEHSYAYSDYFWHWHDSSASVDLYDLKNPSETIEKLASISIDGQYISSRKIGSKLYVISQFTAYIDGYVPHPFSEEVVEQNTDLINQASLEELLPNITINGVTTELLTESDCHIPGSPEEASQPTLAIVTEIDIQNPAQLTAENVQATCVAAPIATIYSSINSVYMAENEYIYDAVEYRNKSHIYRLDYSENGPIYNGSVTLEGQVGWNEQFRLSEYEDHLRVVTSDWSSFESNVHRLHTVTLNDSSMQLNSTIPNESAPEAIGKPGEAIYSVRFNGDKAYIVTFRQIDPFYVLDLTNPDLPRVAGELELPGFSNYLHPFGEDLVFGLGRGSDDGESINNIKVSLFDVSEMSNPTLVNELVLEGDHSYTPALYSHTALSILQRTEEQSWRIGFAASIYDDWQWQRDAYYLYEVRDKDHPEGAGLTSVGSISGNDANSTSSLYYYSDYDRGVLTQDRVHYSHNGSLITESWENLVAPE